MRLASYSVLALLSLLGVAYVVAVYGFFPLGALAHPLMRASFERHPPLVYGHVAVSAVALLLGPAQFSVKLRGSRMSLHRWSGRLYLIAVLLAGVTGLYLSRYAFGGLSVKLAFAALAVTWLYTGYRAYASIRSGNIVQHRRWVVRNFSLTFAGITLRLYIFAGLAMGVPFESVYPDVAWLWLVNLVFAELLFNQTPNPSVDRMANSPRRKL